MSPLAIIFLGTVALFLIAVVMFRRQAAPPPEWLFRPRIAWLWLILFLLSPGPTGFWTGIPLGVEVAAGVLELGVAVYMLVQVCRDSSQRDGDPVLWGLAMLLLGPFAFVVYVYRRRRAEPEAGVEGSPATASQPYS